MSLLSKIRAPRMIDWLIVSVVLCALIWLIAPQQIPTSLYKLSLLSLAAVAGYWIDRSLFPYARPDSFLVADFDNLEVMEESGPEGDELIVGRCQLEDTRQIAGTAMLRRAIIIAAAMITMGLGA